MSAGTGSTRIATQNISRERSSTLGAAAAGDLKPAGTRRHAVAAFTAGEQHRSFNTPTEQRKFSQQKLRSDRSDSTHAVHGSHRARLSTGQLRLDGHGSRAHRVVGQGGEHQAHVHDAVCSFQCQARAARAHRRKPAGYVCGRNGAASAGAAGRCAVHACSRMTSIM
jgi:hypothetical protein